MWFSRPLYLRLGRGISGRSSIVGDSTLYSHGVRVELPYKVRCRIYAGTGGSERFNHTGSVCPFRCFPAGSWRHICPVGHAVTVCRAVCCDTTCCRGHYPNNGYTSPGCGIFQQRIYPKIRKQSQWQ